MIIRVYNAKSHIFDDIRANFSMLELHVVFSGLYTYSAAFIELLFRGLKTSQLYPYNLPTGKKQILAL